MARADSTDDDARTTTGTHTGLSDARLAELLRADTATAYPALHELRTRHSPSLLAYARLCTAGEAPARQLAAHAFTRTVRRIARGTGTEGPLRHRFLLLAAELARDWAADDRSGGLDPGLLLALHTPGAHGPPALVSPPPVPPLRTAFRHLTPRQRGLVWYGVVERESAERTAVLLGVNREDVLRGIPDALHALARSCLRSRLAASPDPRCGDYQRLIEESVRPGGVLGSADLHTHLTRCPHCAACHEEQRALRAAPRATLAEGLLPWAGTAYAGGAGSSPPLPAIRASDEAWPASRRFALASAALGVALVPLLLFLLGAAADGAGRDGSPPGPPPGEAYAQVVNVASGLCLDLRDGPAGTGTDVVTAPCSSSGTQRWRVDAGRGVVQSYARPGHCLAGPDAVGRGLGTAECDTVDGPGGMRLRLTVDGEGRFRPAADPGSAVSADGYGVALRPLDGGAAQRWRAGAR